MSYRVRDTLGLAIKPVKLRFAITKRCNARCIHCNAWKLQQQDPGIKERELTLGELDKIFETSKAFTDKVRSISITGGEPFLRGDVGEIVGIFIRHLPWVTVRINTNGFLTSRIEETVATWAPRTKKMVVNVSLDGFGETHDRMRGVKGAFSKVTSTLDVLRSLRIKRLTVGINFTLNDLNVAEIQEIFHLCQHKGFKFNLIVPHYGHLYQNFESPIPLGEDSKVRALKEVEAIETQDPKPEYRIIKGELTHQARTFRCWAGKVLVLVDYDGKVYPNSGCPSNWWLGDLRETGYSLKEVVTSERARTILKRVRTCRACLLWCEAAPTLRHPEALYYERLGGKV